MSKSITIPEIGMTPIRLRINCTDYVFHAGETQTVPDEVAALLAGIVASIPQPAADGYRTKPATLGDVEDMIAEAFAAHEVSDPEDETEKSEETSDE
jgi:hypothetical protein